jgi:hypothetical protein
VGKHQHELRRSRDGAEDAAQSAAQDGAVRASAVPDRHEPVLVPSVNVLRMSPGDATTITVSLKGASPHGIPDWTPMLANPDSMDRVDPKDGFVYRDASLARSDSVAHAAVVSRSKDHVTIRISAQGPIGRRALFVGCEFVGGERHYYEEIREPIAIVVDSALAQSGRELAEVNERRARGEQVTEDEQKRATDRVMLTADGVVRRAFGESGRITALQARIQGELNVICARQSDGALHGAEILRDALGQHAHGGLIDAVDIGLMLASLFVPGGEILGAATKIAISGIRAAISVARNWPSLNRAAILGAADGAVAAKVGSLRNVSASGIAEGLRELVEVALVKAINETVRRLPVMSAEFLAAAPPTPADDLAAYETALEMALRGALYGGALSDSGALDEEKIHSRAAEQVYRAYLRRAACLSDGRLRATRATRDQQAAVDAASSEIERSRHAEVTSMLGATELVTGQLHRAAADLGMRVTVDEASLREALDAWHSQPHSLDPSKEKRERIEGNGTFPAALYDGQPGRWQQLWNDGVVAVEPEFDGAFYLSSANISGATTRWWFDPQDDVEALPTRGEYIYSLKRVRIQMSGKSSDADAFITVRPPRTFDAVYRFEP